MANKLHIITILIIAISINITSCVFDQLDLKLKLYNNSDKTFYNIIKKDTSLVTEDVTFITDKTWGFTCNVNDTASPTFAFRNHGGYVHKINKEGLDSSLYLYLFEVDSVKKYGWEKIINDEKMYFRKGYKVKDLDSINWVIKISDVVK